MSITVLAIVIPVLSLLARLAPRALSPRVSPNTLEVLASVATGVLLASTLMVVIPHGFHTALTSAEKQNAPVDETLDDEGATSEFTHDAEQSLYFEHNAFAYSPTLLGLTILAGFMIMLLLDRLGAGGVGLGAFALVTPIATALSHLLFSDVRDVVVALALLFSAGTFVYVATLDTLPAIHNPANGRISVRNVVIGIVLFAGVFMAMSATGVLGHGY